MMLDRREMIGGVLAVPFAPRATAVIEDGKLAGALDSLSPEVPPDEKLRRLSAFDPNSLSPSRRIDLLTVRAGATVECEILRRFPFGRTGRSPYRVSAYWGAWKGDDEEAIAAETAALIRDVRQGITLPGSARLSAMAAIAKRPSTPARAALVAAIKQMPAAFGTGITRIEGGQGLFALYLDRYLGGRHSADAARRQIDEAIQRLFDRAGGLLREAGLRSGSIGDRYISLWRDPAYLLAQDDAGRARAIAAMNDRLRRVISLLAPMASGFPARWWDVGISAMSPADVAAARAGYRDNASYYPDLSGLAGRPVWSLESTVVHEAVPGHLLLDAFERGAPPHPRRIEYAPVAAEGWSIFAETLAADIGALDDLHVQLGHVHWLLFRLCRSRADIAIHLDGEDPDVVLARWRALQGVPVPYASFEGDIERIIVEPGFRTAEALAWLELSDAWPSGTVQARITAIANALKNGRTHVDLYALS